jgi:V/A-type H+/Na+-transporting ATPase subunit F
MDVAVLGNESFVMGFKLGGVKRSYIEKPESYEDKILELIADPSIGVLAVSSEDVDRLNPGTRRKVLSSIAPVVVVVGKTEGDLREKVKRAIGVDLYKT